MKRFWVFLGMVVILLAGCSQAPLDVDSALSSQSFGVPGFDQVNDLTTTSTGVYLVGSRPDGSTTEEGFPYFNGYTRKYNAGANFLNFAWDKSIGTRDVNDGSSRIAADSAGNIYFLWNSQRRDPNTGFDKPLTRLYKYAPSGALIWSKVVANKPLDISARDIFVSASDEIYVLGTLAVFPNPNGELDIAIQKFSSGGTLLKTFTKRFSFFCCESVLLPLTIQVDNAGNMYVLYQDGVSDISAGQLFVNLKMFKLNPAGTALWDLAVDSGITFDEGNIPGNGANTREGDFDLDSEGNILLAVQGREFQFSCFDTPDPCGYLNVGYFVRKLNPSGTVTWTKRVDSGRTGTDFGGNYKPSIIVDTDNAIYYAGQTAGSFTGFTNQGSLDIFVARLNSDGSRRWLTQFGSAKYDEVSGIGISQGLYVGGVYNGDNSIPDGNSFLARISRSDGRIANLYQ